MKKKLLALLLTLAMALALAAPAFAVGSDFTINSNGALTKYNGNGGDVTIPDGVTSISNRAFYGCASLTSITIPDSVTSIGGYAFHSCTGLTSVTIPDSVTYIGSVAFCGCTSLASVTIPNSVTSIEEYTFCDCTSLTSITIPDSVTSIGNLAFDSCTSLTSITIPDSVTSIGDFAFDSCTSLTSVTIPGSVIRINTSTFFGCTSLASVVLKEGITSIGGGAFADCTSLTSITIPNSVVAIGYNTFGNCTGLTEVNLPDSVKSIGGNAFSKCTNLVKITIPGSVLDIGNNAFYNCIKLADVTLPARLITIGSGAFDGCKSLTSIIIPGKVAEIGSYAFSDCDKLTSVIFSSGISTINGYAFRGCPNLTNVTIPLTVTCIEEAAFYECPEINNIYYEGTKAQWEMVEIQSWNGSVRQASVHYNSYVENASKDDINNEPVVEGPFVVERELISATSNNKNDNAYLRHASTVKSYLYQEGENLVRVEYINGHVVIEKYSSNFVLLSSYEIEVAPDAIWGGFFPAEKYNFIILGWKNKSKDDSATVLRVIKYDKAWKCLGQADLYNANTTIPFEAGSLRCAEKDGTLFIHTSHERYDGHQANMTVTVRENDMLITSRNNSELTQFFVSHSFNQFILVDQENNIVTLDQGDGSPRAAYLQRKKISGRTTGGTSAAVQRFPGTSGDNTTGASIGGLAETSSGYITVYNYNGIGGAPQEDGKIWMASPDLGPRNIYLSYTPKSDFSTSSTVVTKLTTYDTGSNDTVYTPMLVSTGLEGGYALWRENKNSNNIYYVAYSDDGSVSEVKTAIGSLSDCQPIEYQGKIVWYVTDNSAPIFYVLDKNGLAAYPAKSFTDVPSDAYYYNSVYWAVQNGITNGTGSNTFSPNKTCTNAEIITFLYRANSSPKVSATLPFTPKNAWATDALKWAYSKGIIGADFNEQMPCTRYTTVEYFWKAFGTPNTQTTTKFNDIGGYNASPIAWAVQNNIVHGTNDTTFSPNVTCNRAMIVTLLQRAYDK